MRLKDTLPNRPLLSDTLSVILPTAEQTWLLRACLHSGESGRRAWEVWQESVSDPKKVLELGTRGVKTLAPLLLMALRRNGVVADHSVLTYLRTAYLREDLRSRIFHRVLGNVLSALTTRGVSQVVLKGAALAETVYDEPALRHSHDIDILLEEGDLFRAASMLSALGFASAREEPGAGQYHVKLTHESGLPVELHSRLFRIPYYTAPLGDMWARSQTQVIAGSSTRILSPADNLLHVCALGTCSGSSDSLRWVCDAWHIIAQYPDLEWDVLFECALRSQLALPLSVTLGYMAEALNAPIPPNLLDRLSVAASRTDSTGRQAALLGALTATRGDLKGLISMTRGWRPRARVLAWTLFPSPSYLRWAYHIRHSWLLPFYYLYRPLKYIVYRLSLRWRRGAEPKMPQADLTFRKVNS